LGDWKAAGGGGEGQLVAVDLLVFIRMLILLTAHFGCGCLCFGGVREKNAFGHTLFSYLNSFS
jgi:hypothetical protein